MTCFGNSELLIGPKFVTFFSLVSWAYLQGFGNFALVVENLTRFLTQMHVARSVVSVLAQLVKCPNLPGMFLVGAGRTEFGHRQSRRGQLCPTVTMALGSGWHYWRDSVTSVNVLKLTSWCKVRTAIGGVWKGTFLGWFRDTYGAYPSAGA